DALVLAQAGLERLGLAGQITEILDPSWMLPAVGQGALGLECRTDDVPTRELLRQLDDFATRQAVLAERAFLRAMGGGCQVPMGAAATVSDASLMLRAAVLRPDGSQRVEAHSTGAVSEAERLGETVAQRLREQG